MKRFTTKAITYLLTIFLFDQSIVFAQQGTPSIPQTAVVEPNNGPMQATEARLICNCDTSLKVESFLQFSGIN